MKFGVDEIARWHSSDNHEHWHRLEATRVYIKNISRLKTGRLTLIQISHILFPVLKKKVYIHLLEFRLPPSVYEICALSGFQAA